jgi:glycosyltransferase involved in cell wall biosynthesis
LIVASGPSENGMGPRDAIIAFDMMRYDLKDLHLVIVGSGPEAPALERFARSLAFDDLRVRFVDRTPDAAALFQTSEAVFATRPIHGVEDALEAMVAGNPVIGWGTADLAEIVEDKATGLLVAPGDRAALAAAMRSVLDKPGYSRRLGNAGRDRAQERFGFARMVEQYARLYVEIAPPRAANRPEPSSSREPAPRVR